MARRFRPRFSIRTLAILVTLVCAYFGAWEATKRWGVEKPPVYSKSPAPFLVYSAKRDPISDIETIDGSPISDDQLPRRYYIWLFGLRFELAPDKIHQEKIHDPNNPFDY